MTPLRSGRRPATLAPESWRGVVAAVDVGRNEIGLLRRAGVQPPARPPHALALVRDAAFWSRRAPHALLALGLGHLLAGAAFFFAYNWADLPDLAKFAVVEAGIALAAALALWRGTVRPEGAAALIAASVLTGVLLAVIGQVYQTGADPWQLFALWAGLSLPWALASNNAAHWLVWLAVLQIAAVLYAGQVLLPRELLSDTQALVALALLPFLALAAREVLVARGQSWAGARWTRLVPVMAGLAGFAIGTWQFLLDDAQEIWRSAAGDTVLAPAGLLVALGLLAAVYRRRLPDLGVLAAATGFGALFLIGLFARLIADSLGFDDDIETALASLGLLIFWSVAVMAGAARLLDSLRRGTAARRG